VTSIPSCCERLRLSGIAGICTTDGRPVSPASVQALLAALAQRGPQGSASWLDGNVGLGQLGLGTTPECVGEVQPVLSADGNLCLVADARLDNREELQTAFRARGLTLRDESDGELILHAFATWGEQAPAQLLGDFAFAIWNRRE